MKRVLSVLVAGLAILALPSITLAGRTGAQAKPPAEKTIRTTGTVAAVAPDSLTIKAKNESITLTIDKETEVIAKGATTKTLELKQEGKGTKLTDVVKVGDGVTVAYHERGAIKHAATINVTTQVK